MLLLELKPKYCLFGSIEIYGTKKYTNEIWIQYVILSFYLLFLVSLILPKIIFLLSYHDSYENVQGEKSSNLKSNL